MQRHVLPLRDGWHLRQRSTSISLEDDFRAAEGWLAAPVPGTVHEALLHAGRIPDPFRGSAEREVQWVGQAAWLYRCRFRAPARAAGDALALCLDGLDTAATAWLNGEKVLASDNMFLPHRLDVAALLRPADEENELRVLFEPALLLGRERERQGGAMAVWNGDPSRVYVRKAQYHYGWDWGPVLLTCGPWRPVYLEHYRARILDLHAPAQVGEDLGRATVPVRVAVEDRGEERLWVTLELWDPLGQLAGEAAVPLIPRERFVEFEHRFELAQPHLWWPAGLGAQPRYRLVATLEQDGEVLDRREVLLGLRRLRLLQEPLAQGPAEAEATGFVFEVNNVRLFCGGANWIPADSFPPRVSAARYRALLQAARDAGMVMLRVWGGGYYEEDVFYDTCDELGLLVWQDFMFACGLYPAADWFADSVRAEARAAVRRLRHHPSLVLWCGNNEDYSIAHSGGLYAAARSPEDNAQTFPARLLYERVLPDVCRALDPSRPYWPGSPYGGADPNDGGRGDRHTWDVWHGQMAAYQHYGRFAGRFVSEFGMQGFPDRRTVASFAGPGEAFEGLRPDSPAVLQHNKATDGPQRIDAYLEANLRVPADLDGYLYATQLLQAEALGHAFRSFRRRFGGPGAEAIAGALVWQLNDCWPVVSWSLIDYFLRRKPAYYAVKRELAPLALGLHRSSAQAAPELWAVNGTLEPVEAVVLLRTFALDGAPRGPERRLPVRLPPNQALELGPSARAEAERGGATAIVHGARLLVGERIAARAALWPEPLKDLELSDPGLSVERLPGDRLRLRAARPAKGVLLSADDAVVFSDNLLDLLPEDEQEVEARGLGAGPLGLRWLGQSQAGPIFSCRGL